MRPNSEKKREARISPDELPAKLDLYSVNTASQNWHFLLNPAAARGKAGLRWQTMLPKLKAHLPNMTWAQSSAKIGMANLAEAAVRNGYLKLVGVGGDGTHHEVLNGIVAADALEQVTYSPFPLGTGNDWVRTLGTSRELTDWVKVLVAGKTIRHSVGRIRYGEDQSRVRYFLNVAGMAYDAEVVRRSEQMRFKHRLLYPLLTLVFLKDFTPPEVKVVYGKETFIGAVHTINFGIGRYSGGGMRLVPQADPQADTLALTIARRLPVWKILAESWRFYTGTIGAVKEVTLTQAHSVIVEPINGRIEFEADGEWLGSGALEVDVLQRKLRVIIPNE
ncbi:MAG: diacylglycerol kinase family protein [Bacteroidota bacterium]